MGSYKYLIIYFCLSSLLVSILEEIVHPFMLSVGSTFVLIMDLSDSFVTERENAETLIHMTCGCYGFILCLIAIHFIFRFFAIERGGKLKYFRAHYWSLWFTLPIIYGGAWGSATYLFLEQTDRVTNVLSNHLEYECKLTTLNFVYTGGDYFTDDTKQHFNMSVLPGIVTLATIMGTSLLVVIYCGIRTFIGINDLEKRGRSSYTKNLQKQLFKALVVQSCIPFFLLYLPVSVFLFVPILNVEFDQIGHIVTLFCAIYPAIDPLPTIFIVDPYRKAVTSFVVSNVKCSLLAKLRNTTI